MRMLIALLVLPSLAGTGLLPAAAQEMAEPPASSEGDTAAETAAPDEAPGPPDTPNPGDATAPLAEEPTSGEAIASPPEEPDPGDVSASDGGAAPPDATPMTTLTLDLVECIDPGRAGSVAIVDALPNACSPSWTVGPVLLLDGAPPDGGDGTTQLTWTGIEAGRSYTLTGGSLAPVAVAIPDAPGDAGVRRIAARFVASPDDPGDDPPRVASMATQQSNGYAFAIDVSPASLAPGAPVTYTITASGILTNASGLPVANGMVTIETFRPSTSDARDVQIEGNCSPVGEFRNGEARSFDLLCFAGPDGSFDYTITFTDTAPATPGQYQVTGDLFGAVSPAHLASHTSVLTVVGGQTSGEVFFTISPTALEVAPGDSFSYEISLRGNIIAAYDETTISIETLWDDLEPSLPALPDGCTVAFSDGEFLTVSCTPADPVNTDITLTFTGTAPDEPGQYGIGANLYAPGTTFDVLKELTATLTVAGSAPGGGVVFAITPEELTVAPGETYTFEVTLTGDIFSEYGEGTVYIETGWEGLGRATRASSSPQECVQEVNSLDPLYGYHWLDYFCQPADPTDVSLTFVFTGTAPARLGLHDIVVGLYAPDWSYSGPDEERYARLRVTDGSGSGDVAFSLSPETIEVDVWEPFSYEVSVSGDVLGAYDADTLYIETLLPFGGIEIDGRLPRSCEDYGYDGSDERWLDIECTPSSPTSADYTFRFTGTAPAHPGEYEIIARLWLPSWGDHLVSEQTLTLVVTGEDPGALAFDVTPLDIEVLPGGTFTFDVSLSGDLHALYRAEDFYLEARARIPSLTIAPGLPECDYTTTGPDFWYTGLSEVRCTPPDPTAADYTFRVTGTAPETPGTYRLEVHLWSPVAAELTGPPTAEDYPNLRVIQPAASDVALDCEPAEISVPAGTSATLDCRIASQLDADQIGIHLDRVSIGRPAGWTVTAAGGTFDPATSTLALDTAFLGRDEEALFSLTLTPSCDAGDGTLSLDTRIGYGRAGDTPSRIDGPELDVPLATDGSQSGFAAAFTDSAPVDAGTARVTDRAGSTVSGTATLTIDRAACASGSVRVWIDSTDGTSFDTEAPEGRIPLANVSISDVAATGEDGAISPEIPTGSLATPATVATLAAAETAATSGLTLTLAIAVPAGTAPGTHTATLSIDTTGNEP